MKIRHFAALPLMALVFLGIGCSKPAPEPEPQPVDSAQTLEDGTYEIDTRVSKLVWNGQRRDGTVHVGTVDVERGQVNVKEGRISSGLAIVDMDSLNCTNISGADKEKLETHLKSKDFFNVSEFPEATFRLTGFSEREGKRFLSGNLTIKGIEQSFSFPAQIESDGETMTIVSEFELDRTKWDIRYGSGKFFENLGDQLIKDEIGFSMNLVLIREKEDVEETEE